MSSSIKTCFISAPADAKLEILRGALDKRGIAIVAPNEFGPLSSWSSEITNPLAKVDLVIGVFTRRRRSDWTLFELGQAWAHRVRILIIAPPVGGIDVPVDLKGLLTLRASLTNREAIEFALDQLVAAPKSVPARSLDVPRHVLGERADQFLQDAMAAVRSHQGLRVERIVENALRASGVEAVATDPSESKPVDLAIWSDGLQFSLGNPLLVEIKARLRGPPEGRRAAAQLSKSVLSSSGKWGLLLYGVCGEQATSKVLQNTAQPNVLVLSITELFNELRHRPFADVVRHLRNRRVHGIAD